MQQILGKAVVAMSKQDIVSGIPKLEEDKHESSLCSGCALGKLTASLFDAAGGTVLNPAKGFI
jgi:hypothetical protein